MLYIEQIRVWTSQDVTVYRAVPLPSVANQNGITTVYPPNEMAEEFFRNLGQVVLVVMLEVFDAFVTAGATMRLYFDIFETVTQWLLEQSTQYEDTL